MISQAGIGKILGIKEKVHLSPEEMVHKLKVCFYPDHDKANKKLISFAENLKESLERLNVEIVSHDAIYEHRPLSKRIKRFVKFLIFDALWISRKILYMNEVDSYIPFKSIIGLSGSKRIKKGICVICVGEQNTERLLMQYISNFKDNSIITIVDFPDGIDRNTDFKTHFDAAMKLFAYHMTNIVIGVSDTDWMIYNFNASHPIYPLNDGKFDFHILKALIPKIVAPISPHKIEEFIILTQQFDSSDPVHAPIIKEMQEGARLFDHTKLYPKGKKIDELPFRHAFHRLIGKLHLDNRNGMSFGYLAFQMPTKLSEVVSLFEFEKKYPGVFDRSDIFTDPQTKSLFILWNMTKGKFVIKVPDVWVMTIRSGADKTHFDPKTDLLKIGLINGEMVMQLPQGMKIYKDYKPSFDTKVILAHAVGNAIIASLIKVDNEKHDFVVGIQQKGLSLSHWHGYFNKDLLPVGVDIYGAENLHVSCSSPQSAVYALDGKLNSFYEKISKDVSFEYRGDVHVEPHHGINVTFPSLVVLAQYILDNPEATALGNKYL